MRGSGLWPRGESLADVLLDPGLWAVDKLEDQVLVVYYARWSTLPAVVGKRRDE